MTATATAPLSVERMLASLSSKHTGQFSCITAPNRPGVIIVKHQRDAGLPVDPFFTVSASVTDACWLFNCPTLSANVVSASTDSDGADFNRVAFTSSKEFEQLVSAALVVDAAQRKAQTARANALDLNFQLDAARGQPLARVIASLKAQGATNINVRTRNDEISGTVSFGSRKMLVSGSVLSPVFADMQAAKMKNHLLAITPAGTEFLASWGAQFSADQERQSVLDAVDRHNSGSCSALGVAVFLNVDFLSAAPSIKRCLDEGLLLVIGFAGGPAPMPTPAPSPTT